MKNQELGLYLLINALKKGKRQINGTRESSEYLYLFKQYFLDWCILEKAKNGNSN